MAQQIDGRIIIGGGLVNYNGTARKSVARINGNLYVVWEAGDAFDKTVQLPIVDDALDEPTEFLEFSVTPLLGGATVDTNSTATLDLIDNDLAGTDLSSVSGGGLVNSPLTLTATLSASGSPLVGKTVSFTLFGTPLGTAQTDAGGVATLTTSPPPGIGAGIYPNVVGATFSGDAQLAGSSATGQLTITEAAAPAATNFSAVSGSGPYNDKVNLTASLRSGATPLSGRTVSFTLLGTAVGTAQTDGSGVATLQNVSLSGVGTGTYTNAVGASFTGDAGFAANSATGPLSVTKADASVTLGSAALIYDGSVKSASATTSRAGLGVSFIYKQGGVIVGPPVNAGSYDVTATITDANYQGSTTGVLVINKATPVITWSNPGDINYGTALGGAQLNATASTAGSFAYTPPAGTILNVGNNQTLSVSFTPADATNYTTANASAKINVAKAAPAITWDAPADITYGTALDATQLNATASTAGAFVYTPASGTVLNACNNQTLAASFTPTDTVNYNDASKSVLVNVLKASQTITFDQPSDKKFGDAPFALSATATSGLPVTFEVVSGPATLNGGQLTMTGVGQVVVKAKQAGDGNYTAASDVVRVFQVSSPGASVRLSNLTYTYDGAGHAATATTTPAGLNVTLSYSQNGAPVQSPTGAGNYVVMATIDDLNYSGSAMGVLVINKATPALTWANPSNISFGTALGGAQLDAQSSIPGTFQYAPPSGTVLGAGVNQLSVTFTPTDAANYTTVTATVQLTVEQVTAPALNFDSAAESVNEGAGNVTLTVNRTGPATGEADVRYATSDSSGLNDCSLVTGAASARCDYATTVGVLHFAPGEIVKTISIPIVDDSYAEGSEIFTVTLSDAVGERLGSVRTATLTITDNDAVTGTNPLSDTAFFLRQQYIDFLGREPDPGGFAAWADILNNCGVTVASPCDRIEVSSAFFRSQEFQTRGYFVYRFYSASLGRIPHYSEFMTDLSRVNGFLTDAQLEANRAAFVQEFMTRAEFRNKYGALADAAYVDALLQTAGLPAHPLAGAWKNGLANGSLTRAQVLRALVESAEVAQKFYNEAFVVMQYFGYLRRDPDVLYLEWIRIMNQNGGDYRIMVSGFLGSNEYVRRFGP